MKSSNRLLAAVGERDGISLSLSPTSCTNILHNIENRSNHDGLDYNLFRDEIAIASCSLRISSTANMAKRLDPAGAEALVLFNRFYQPDINLNLLDVEPNVLLSTPQSMRLPLRWIAILYDRISADLAGTSGIHRGDDALKMLMAGAKITMLCSVLLRHGINHIRVIEQEMREWMQKHEYESIQQMQGSMSQKHCPNPSAFERAQYMRSLRHHVKISCTKFIWNSLLNLAFTQKLFRLFLHKSLAPINLNGKPLMTHRITLVKYQWRGLQISNYFDNRLIRWGIGIFRNCFVLTPEFIVKNWYCRSRQ